MNFAALFLFVSYCRLVWNLYQSNQLHFSCRELFHLIPPFKKKNNLIAYKHKSNFLWKNLCPTSFCLVRKFISNIDIEINLILS